MHNKHSKGDRRPGKSKNSLFGKTEQGKGVFGAKNLSLLPLKKSLPQAKKPPD